MLKFIVRGNSGNYEIIASRTGVVFQISCTCTAGQNGMCCRHRFALLDEDDSDILSGNSGDIAKLKVLFHGTDVEKRYARMRSLEAQKRSIELALRMEKKALGRQMSPASFE